MKCPQHKHSNIRTAVLPKTRILLRPMLSVHLLMVADLLQRQRIALLILGRLSRPAIRLARFFMNESIGKWLLAVLDQVESCRHDKWQGYHPEACANEGVLRKAQIVLKRKDSDQEHNLTVCTSAVLSGSSIPWENMYASSTWRDASSPRLPELQQIFKPMKTLMKHATLAEIRIL